MAEHNDKIKNHVQAARDWLGKAERSLDQQNEFKSNLNLMLAQAELQRAKETDCGAVWFNQPVLLIRNIAIVVVAGLIVAFGFSGFNINKAKVPLDNSPANRIESPVTLPAQVPLPREAEPVTEKTGAVENKPEVLLAPTAPVAPAKVKAEITEPKEPPAIVGQPAEKAAISAEEMQQLMRSAGKSLRGQN